MTQKYKKDEILSKHDFPQKLFKTKRKLMLFKYNVEKCLFISKPRIRKTKSQSL